MGHSPKYFYLKRLNVHILQNGQRFESSLDTHSEKGEEKKIVETFSTD